MNKRSKWLSFLRLAVLVIAGVLVVLIGIWRLSRARSFQLAGELVTRVATDSMVVALTFDDGPTPEGTRLALEMTRALNFPATFFLTGSELQQAPELGRSLAQAGHQIANHSFSHQRMVFRSPAFVRQEIESTDSLIRQTGYRDPILFRPPYANRFLVLPLYLQRHGRPTLLWDVEPESYPDVASSAEGIAEHVLARVRPGSIILMHIMYSSREESRRAVPLVVRGLRDRGYRLVTVNQMMSIAAGEGEGGATGPEHQEHPES